MLDEILKAVSDQVGGELNKKVGLSPKQTKEAISLTGDVAMNAVTEQLKSGDLSTVMNLFSSKPNTKSADGLENQMKSMLTSKLGSSGKFPMEKIGPIVSLILPVVLNLISKKNDATPDDDSSPLTEIFGNLTKGGLGKSAGGFLKDLF